jgi:hypothetical protein
VNRRTRLLIAAPLALTGILVLTACEITASGSGTVTIESKRRATAYDPGPPKTGTVAYVCDASAAECKEDDPWLYVYYPATGSDRWVVSPGFPVFNRLNQRVGLPAGRYTVQATHYPIDPPPNPFSNPLTINVFRVSPAVPEPFIVLPPVEHTLGFNANGGICTVTNGGPIVNGVWIRVPTAEQCMRPGYTLLGWNPKSDGSDPLGFDPGGWTLMTDNNTLYAIWVPVR